MCTLVVSRISIPPIDIPSPSRFPGIVYLFVRDTYFCANQLMRNEEGKKHVAVIPCKKKTYNASMFAYEIPGDRL